MNDHQEAEDYREPNQRKVYRPPNLTEYGRVRRITLGSLRYHGDTGGGGATGLRDKASPAGP
jgi:hypothetical protein